MRERQPPRQTWRHGVIFTLEYYYYPNCENSRFLCIIILFLLSHVSGVVVLLSSSLACMHSWQNFINASSVVIFSSMGNGNMKVRLRLLLCSICCINIIIINIIIISCTLRHAADVMKECFLFYFVSQSTSSSTSGMTC